MSADVAVPPTLRMVGAVLFHVEQFFAESGVPLSPEQAAALHAARDATFQQADDLGGAA